MRKEHRQFISPSVIVIVLALAIVWTGAQAQQRPMDLAPGETNWTAQPNAADPTTTDLNSVTPTDLANALAGGGVTISNVIFSGDNVQAGLFTGGTGIIGFESGVIISSGNIASVRGPLNVSDNITTGIGLLDCDPELALVTNNASVLNDCASLQFDIECEQGAAENVTFRFVFSSDEYNEYANSTFNDAFALLVDGVNVALLPDLITPVSINTVNGGDPDFECSDGADNDGDGPFDGADSDCTTPLDNIVAENNQNSAFYLNNDCSDPDGGAGCPPPNLAWEMDGQTVVLTATAAIAPGPHTVRLAIADAGDTGFDSNTLIESGSVQCAETGACCTSGSCSIQTAADCQALGGVYQGDGSACGPDTCPAVPTTGASGMLAMFVSLLLVLGTVLALRWRSVRRAGLGA